MRGHSSAILVSCLLVALVIAQVANIPIVLAFLDAFEGDLILVGNDVYIIEGAFDINGSMVVEGNATLIVRNASVNFDAEEDGQFNITLRNPSNGNPRLLVEDSTINSNECDLPMWFYGNSSVTVDTLIGLSVWPYALETSSLIASDLTIYGLEIGDSAVVNVSDSIISDGIYVWGDSTLNLSNCTAKYLEVYGQTGVSLSGCTIDDYVHLFVSAVDCLIDLLRPGYVSYWDFMSNCSVVSDGPALNFTVTGSIVGGWLLDLEESSGATITRCELRQVSIWSDSSLLIYDSAITVSVWGTDSTSMRIYDSSVSRAEPRENATIWLVNSTVDEYTFSEQSAVLVCWYLDAHVIDSIGQNVPAARVTANYPNATLAESRLTNAEGWVKLTLIDEMVNSTGSYRVGSYAVEAKYQSHLRNTSVSMTENREVTLTLESLVIPEFPNSLFMPLFLVGSFLLIILCGKKRFWHDRD